MLVTVVSVFLALLSSWVFPSAHCSAEDVELRSKLRARVHDYRLEASGFVDALTRVAGDFEIPIGVEWVDTDVAKAKLTRSWKDATVQEIIEAVVKMQRGYQVHIKNNIVHVYSPRLVPERQNFLRLKVRQFEVNNVPVELASRKLRELVKMTVSPAKKKAGKEAGGGSRQSDWECGRSQDQRAIEQLHCRGGLGCPCSCIYPEGLDRHIFAEPHVDSD